MECRAYDVVVLPLVPVTPYTRIRREGFPYTAADSLARARRASGTTAVGVPGTSRSATTSGAPRLKASAANLVPSRLKPGTATKTTPGTTPRESWVTPDMAP